MRFLKASKKQNKDMTGSSSAAVKFLDKVVIFCGASIWLFVAIMTVTYWVTGDVPEPLITGFFTVFGGEGAVCAIITISKNLLDRHSRKKLNQDDEMEE